MMGHGLRLPCLHALLCPSVKRSLGGTTEPENAEGRV